MSMKKAMTSLIIFCSSTGFIFTPTIAAAVESASASRVVCRITYAVVDGAATINAVQTFDLSPYTYTQLPIGNLILHVGLGGTAVVSTAIAKEEFPTIFVEIFEKNLQTGQVGGISVNPNFPATASYRSDDGDSLTVSCALAR